MQAINFLTTNPEFLANASIFRNVSVCSSVIPCVLRKFSKNRDLKRSVDSNFGGVGRLIFRECRLYSPEDHRVLKK